MANKSELIAQIVALETALTEAGVEFSAVDQSATNDILAQEITRLESLLPEDGEEGEDGEGGNDGSLSDGTGGTDGTGDTNGGMATGNLSDQLSEIKPVVGTVKTRKVLIKKGINVEIKIDNQTKVLKGETEYELPADRAKSIVAENLGLYADE